MNNVARARPKEKPEDIDWERVKKIAVILQDWMNDNNYDIIDIERAIAHIHHDSGNVVPHEIIIDVEKIDKRRTRKTEEKQRCPRCGHYALEPFTNVNPHSDFRLSMCKRCGFKKASRASGENPT